MESKYELNYSPYKHNGKVSVACWQWFDLFDYNIDNFVRDKYGNDMIFDSEYALVEWINQNIKPEYIDKKYRNKSTDIYL